METKRFHSFFSTFLLLIIASCASPHEEVSVIESLEDLNSLTIAVTMGTTQDEYASASFPNATIMRMESSTDMSLAVDSGQADAMILDEGLAEELCDTDNKYYFLARDVYFEPFGIGFNDAVLVNEFNKFLSEATKSGLLEEIKTRWKQDGDNAQMPEFNFGAKKRVLTVGTESSFFPFSFLRDGSYHGIDIELMSRFCESQEYVPEFVSMPFGSLIAAVSTGKVDCIASGITITEERKKEILFSDVYFNSSSSVLILKSRSKQMSIEGASLAVLTGSSQDLFASEHYTKSNILRFESQDQLLRALESKVADYALLGSVTIRAILREHNDFRIFVDSVKVDSVCVVVPKDNKELYDKFNVYLNKIKSSGELTLLENKWLYSSENPTDFEIPDSKEKGVLRIGTTGEAYPFSYFLNGKPVGFDVELLVGFAQSLGLKPVITTYPFMGMLTAVITKKVDIAANIIMPTAERRKQLLMTDPYFLSKAGIIANKDNSQREGMSWIARLKDSFNNNLVKEDRYKMILKGLGNTLLISLLSIIFGTILGGVICAMRMSKQSIIKKIAMAYIGLLRGIPQVVLLMLMFYVVFASTNLNGTIVSTITFVMVFAAYVSEMFRSSIESIDKGQSEAAVAMGFSKARAFRLVVFPQALTRVLPVFKGEVISLVKMTSIVGYIAVQDLTKMGDIIRSRTFDAFFPLIFVAIIYFILAKLLTLLINLIEKKISPYKRRHI